MGRCKAKLEPDWHWKQKQKSPAEVRPAGTQRRQGGRTSA